MQLLTNKNEYNCGQSKILTASAYDQNSKTFGFLPVVFMNLMVLFIPRIKCLCINRQRSKPLARSGSPNCCMYFVSKRSLPEGHRKQDTATCMKHRKTSWSVRSSDELSLSPKNVMWGTSDRWKMDMIKSKPPSLFSTTSEPWFGNPSTKWNEYFEMLIILSLTMICEESGSTHKASQRINEDGM